MTLYLALYRPSLRPLAHPRPETPWDAYLPSLPREFAPWHPLTWPREYHGLGRRLSRGARTALDVVRRSWARDAAVLRSVIRAGAVWRDWADGEVGFRAEGRSKPGTETAVRTAWVNWWRARSEREIEADLTWAWLNGGSHASLCLAPPAQAPNAIPVHTRSLYLPLDLPSLSADLDPGAPKPEQNNHTLCPALDLLNHASAPGGASPCVVQYAEATRGAGTPLATGPSSSPRRAGPRRAVPAHDFLLRSPPDRTVRAGEEATFEYGMRGDDDLFADYGFVPRVEAGEVGADATLGNRYAQVDVSWWIESAWAKMDSREAETKRQILEDHGYWG